MTAAIAAAAELNAQRATLTGRRLALEAELLELLQQEAAVDLALEAARRRVRELAAAAF